MGRRQVRTQARDNCATSPEQPRCCPGTVPVQFQYNPGKSHRYRPGTARNSSASNPAPARCRFRNKPGALGRYRPGMALVRPVYSNCVRTQPQYSPRRTSRPRNHCQGSTPSRKRDQNEHAWRAHFEVALERILKLGYNRVLFWSRNAGPFWSRISDFQG